MLLAQLDLAQRDVDSAAAHLTQAEQFVHQHNFVHLMPEIVAAEVILKLHQGNLAAAAYLAENNELPISQARVRLAQGDPTTALALLGAQSRQAQVKGWQDVQLKVKILEAIAHLALGENEQAVQELGDALALAEPGGFNRIFVDEGVPMEKLLSEAAALGMMPDYVGKLMAIFEAETRTALDSHQAIIGKSEGKSSTPPAQPLVEPLNARELEVLQLIAEGLSNSEIGERLFLALSTVKGHNRMIFDKLQVQRRTEAVARGRELGLV